MNFHANRSRLAPMTRLMDLTAAARIGASLASRANAPACAAMLTTMSRRRLGYACIRRQPHGRRDY